MLEERIELQNRLHDLMNLGIEQIAIINKSGRVECIFSKNKMYLSRERQEMFFMGFRLHQSLLDDYDDEFGPVKCMIVERQNIKLVSIPFFSYVVLSVMNVDFNHEFLVRKIHELKDIYSGRKLLADGCLCAEALTSHG
ncbi:MAG: hypothetical protein ACREA8_01585 [Nitrosotalea sp.]